jgi:hypothetical protein
MAHISRPDPMYLWALRLLLERVSWFVGDNGGESAIVTFAHRKGFRAQKLHDYRAALEATDEIEPDAFENTEPRYLEELRPKLYRRGNAKVTSYGLKVFPTSVSEPDGPLAFLREF